MNPAYRRPHPQLPPQPQRVPPPARRARPGPPTGPIPPVPELTRRRAELSDAALVSRSWAMAFATLVSRLTGFARIVVLAAILGAALSSAFSVANQLPNLVARARPGGDVHRDLRAGAGPCRAKRPRRRRRVRAAPGHVDYRAVGARHGAVGAGRTAVGAADAGPRPAGQRAADHGLRLPAASPGARLRADVGVHGDPEHPQRLRADGLGTGRQQRRRARDPGGVSGCPRRTFGRPGADGQRQAAGARHRHHAGCVRADRRAVRGAETTEREPAPAVGNRSAPQALRHDGRGNGALRADQSARPGDRQPDRQHRGGFRARDLQLHLAGPACCPSA